MADWLVGGESRRLVENRKDSRELDDESRVFVFNCTNISKVVLTGFGRLATYREISWQIGLLVGNREG